MQNPMIFMVLSGHAYLPAVDGVSLGENLRIDRSDTGHPVYQANTVGPDGPAGSANGGGWLRFMRFDVTRRQIHFYAYSPLLNRYAGQDGEASFGAPTGYADFEPDFPPQISAKYGCAPPHGSRRDSRPDLSILREQAEAA